MHDYFKTKAGTELPLINLKGKAYLQVAHRLVWFREEHPEWSIQTEYVRIDENHAIAKATISDDGGKIIATGHKCEDKKGFADFAEKAETGSIGRALAACGYGTQFAPELDEEERIVDNPVNQVSKSAARPQNAVPTQNVTHPSEAQLAKLKEIILKGNWTAEDVKAYLGLMGMKTTKELNWFQYLKMVESIEKFPKLKTDHHPA